MDPQANLSSEPIACNLTKVRFKRQQARGVSLRRLGIGVHLHGQGAPGVHVVTVVPFHAAFSVISRFCNQLARELEPPERMASGYVGTEA